MSTPARYLLLAQIGFFLSLAVCVLLDSAGLHSNHGWSYYESRTQTFVPYLLGFGWCVLLIALAAGLLSRSAAPAGFPAALKLLSVLLLLDVATPDPVDAAFSNAVFHWIPDHDKLFERLFAALRPGGRLVAQCGGAGNIDRFHTVMKQVAYQPPFDEYLGGWDGPWNYAGPAETGARLAAAGFTDAQCWLEEWPVEPDEPEEFIRTVCMGHHLERMPEDLRPQYVERVWERVPKPLTLDYVRLNIDARRPA